MRARREIVKKAGAVKCCKNQLNILEMKNGGYEDGDEEGISRFVGSVFGVGRGCR
jgi:hypothetical protein